MYSVRVFNHELSKTVNRFTFDSKREANKFVIDNCEKRGYDYFSKEDRSVEYMKGY